MKVLLDETFKCEIQPFSAEDLPTHLYAAPTGWASPLLYLAILYLFSYHGMRDTYYSHEHI